MVGRPRGDVLVEVLDPASDRPVFRQISDHLRDVIASGKLGEGDQLPSEAQLAEHYGITRTTAREALAVLEAEGLVIAEHGKGRYVRPRPQVRRLGSDRFARRHREAGKAAFVAEVEAAGSAPAVDQITVTVERPSPETGERPGLRPGGRWGGGGRRSRIDAHRGGAAHRLFG